MKEFVFFYFVGKTLKIATEQGWHEDCIGAIGEGRGQIGVRVPALFC